jgi:2-dehydropantoate 2-reductase
MRILVMGSGGIGGDYGYRLAKAGNEVVFTARGAHLEAMQTRGLEMRERDGSTDLLPVQAVRYPIDAGGTFDFVLFAVKTYDTTEAAEAIKPVVGPETSVLPIQNGVDSVDWLSAVIPGECVLVGSTDMSAKIAEPGVIQRLSQGSRIPIGEQSGPVSDRVRRIVAAFNAAGIPDCYASDDPRRALWEKFMFLAPIATVNSATGLPTGPLRSIPEGKALVLAMQAEIRAVGTAAGVNLPDEAAERVKGMYLGVSEGHTVSMQRDFEAGKRVELETLTGSVVRRGKEHGVPTPNFSAFYPILRAKALSFGGVS